MRKLASVVEIASCDPIPETERLSVATMTGKGWRVVTGRDEFAPGDRAVYFEIDSYLPPDDERFAFLRERCLRKFVSKSGGVLREGFRIKTAKLRGVVSQGLLMPVVAFPEANGLEVGADLTDLLKVEHYDEVKEQLQPAMGNPLNSDAMGAFPSYIPKSDEERLQGLTEYFTSLKGRRFEITAKDDGSSATMFFSPTIYASGERVFYVTDWILLAALLLLLEKIPTERAKNAFVASALGFAVLNLLTQVPEMLAKLNG